MAKGRASAQKLKRDPLMEQYMNTSAWVKDRSRPITKWLTIAAVVIAVAAIAWMLLSRRAKNAGESMAEAMAAHDALVQNPIPPTLGQGQKAFTTEDEKHHKAYEAFTKAANDYPSYNGDLARYFAAIHQLHFEADKAEATLKELAQKDSEVSSQASMALAERYEAVGKNDDALAEYKRLRAKPGVVPPALIDVSMARVYEATGKTKEAVDLYFGVASNKELRSASVGNTAAMRLAAIAPEKLDQLPPPEQSGPRFPGGGMMLPSS